MKNPKLWMVNRPVANLRRQKVAHEGKYTEDADQETQVLLGEPLLGFQEEEDWVFVHAPNQPFFKDGEWTGYPGWIQKRDLIEVGHTQYDTLIVAEHGALLKSGRGTEPLSIGTPLEHDGEVEDEWKLLLPDESEGFIAKDSCLDIGPGDPEEMLDYAKSFIGMPYLWGGRSSYMEGQLSGVDCSGLTHLVHGLIGIIIPRNAGDQYARSLKIDGKDVRQGDLVFLAKKGGPEKITHVMMALDEERLIEATTTVGKVREISVFERLGKSLKAIEHGGDAGEFIVRFGSFLNSEEII